MNPRPRLVAQSQTPLSRNLDDLPILAQRLGADAPQQLWLIGDPALLATHKTALFCSARCPGDAILRAHDTAARLRDQGETVISGASIPRSNGTACTSSCAAGNRSSSARPAPWTECVSPAPGKLP